MRDGSGNKLSLEEEKKVRSIQVTPDPDANTKVSIEPEVDDKSQAQQEPERPGTIPAVSDIDE